MDSRWLLLDARPNKDSRGIKNLGNCCFQLSVFQALLHQPSFLHWILTHNTAENACPEKHCVACFMQQLVEEYWGECPPENPIEAARNDAGSIAWHAFQSGMFQRGAQEDARLFYTWLLDQFFEDVQEPRAKSWQDQHKSHFQIELQPTDTCTTCNHPTNRALQTENILNLGILNSHKNIYDAVMDHGSIR
ncbi:hypothetical protein BKA63DRAFT_566731 [Paraphoma chrysanthemicola]|nr:hypothetical protein BKA63DRAFT_566731 [Paraphoma chrysanthemicola]